MVGTEKVDFLATYARSTLDLEHARLGDGYYYLGLPQCAIDTVFSIGVRYSNVRKVVDRYCRWANVAKFRPDRQRLPDRDSQEPISHFCEQLEGLGSDDRVVEVFGNRQRTSSRNGILKAQATLRFAQALRAHKIEYLQDMAELSPEREAAVERDIHGIPGHGSGISWSYFRMLTGTEDLVKPDRMILRFIEEAIGSAVRPGEAQHLVAGASIQLEPVFRNLRPVYLTT